MSQPDVCSSCGGDARNLVVCIDGTSNQYGDKNTNVVELYSRLVKNGNQLTFYNSGIGTYARPSRRSLAHYRKVISHTFDLMLALRFEKIIFMAYAWLAENYQTGDRIFLFGFSRGAYQVRTLAAMIAEVGLIHRGNDGQIPFAYELYANSGEDTLSRGKSKTARFKETFSRDVKIHFVGAWDTVSSIGLARKSTLLPRTADGMHHVCYFRHALALDERRVKFLPEYVRGGAGPDAHSAGEDVANRSGTVDPPHTKEVWFKGCHSDIGGGAVNNEHLSRFGPALRWMSFEALLAGIKLSPGPLNWTVTMQTNSMTAIWVPMELFPIKRLSYKNATKTTRRPHLRAARVVKPYQLIHATVFDSVSTLYAVKLEPDPYTDAWRFLRIIQDCVQLATGELLGNEGLKSLQVLLETVPGQQSLRDLGNDIIFNIHAMLDRCAPGVEQGGELACNVHKTLHAARDGLAFNFDGMPRRSLSSLLGLPPPAGYCYPLPMHRAAAGVSSVAYAQSTSSLVAAYSDGAICSWDVTRGEMSQLWATQHDASIRGISVSRDSRWVVSASDDCTLVLWDLAAHEPRRRLRTQGYRALSVAFSPDAATVVCALFNGDVGIWDLSVEGVTDADGYETLQRRLPGHSDSVRSIACAPNGRYFVSGSDDTTLRLWELRTLHNQPAEMADAAAAHVAVLSGHTDWVRIVSFSPGGDLIASGSDDGSVRLWDVKDQTSVAVIQWHQDPVDWLDRITALAFSPSGHYVAAASLRGVIHLVDTATEGDVVEVHNGHSGAITTLAFAPDESHVVSGTNEGTIQVWDRVPAPPPTTEEDIENAHWLLRALPFYRGPVHR